MTSIDTLYPAFKRTLLLVHAAATFAFSVFADTQPGTNALISSGDLSLIANTPIYTNDGITLTIGGIGDVAFDVTARLQDSLIKLDTSDNPAVMNDWATVQEYEVWTDRLILRKTTNFYVLDGAEFAQSFNGSVGDFNTNGITSVPINLPDINLLVQDYIDSGEYLELYEEARNAGSAGAAELITELKQDRGPVTLIETIEFSRLLKTIDDPIAPHSIDILAADPVNGKELNSGKPASIEDSRLDSFETGTQFSDDTGGIISYSQNMLNGFTIGNEWSKGITYDRRWFYVHTSAFAGFGLGIRIPWTAKVEVSKRMIPHPLPDRTSYDASIEVETLDADPDFYRDVGLPPQHRLSGREMPLEAGAGIALQIKVLGLWALDHSRINPIVGKVIDMSHDFDPPLGTTMNIATLELPYENSGFAYLTPLAAVGGDFKADVGIHGDSIDLRVKPFNSWNVNGSEYSKRYRNISLTNEATPLSLSFAIDDNASSEGQNFYNFGPVYDQASYQTSLTITPSARIRGTAYLSQLWDVLSDINISSNWHPLFTADFSLPSLGPHAGIESKLEATHRSQRILPPTLSVQPNRFISNPSPEVWDFIIGELGNESLVLIEYIADDFDLAVGSITNQGTYDESDRTITWNFSKQSVPEKVSYRCNSTANSIGTVPEPVGSFETSYTIGNTQHDIDAAIRDIRYASTSEAESDLANFNLEKRPTLEDYNTVVTQRDSKLSLQEVKDLRPGSKMIQIQNGQATVSMELEQSDDLNGWTLGGTASGQVPADSQIKFFRFKMTE